MRVTILPPTTPAEAAKLQAKAEASIRAAKRRARHIKRRETSPPKR